MSKRKVFVLVFAFAFLMFFIGSVSATTRTCNSVSTCDSAILSSAAGDVVNLTASITGVSTYVPAVDFHGVDNITFDCQGYWINGTGASNSNAVYFNNSNSGSNYDTLKNCKISNFTVGVYVYHSSYNNITNITITNITGSSNTYGLYVTYYSPNNTFSDMNISTVGLISYGVNIGTVSPGNVFRNVHINGTFNTFRIFSGTFSDYVQDIDTSNTVNGKTIYYNVSASNYEFNSTTAPNAGMVVCVNCNNVTYKDLYLDSKAYTGLIFVSTNNSAVDNVTSTLNGYGLEFYGSSGNTISNINASNIYNATNGAGYNGLGLESGSSNNTLINITTNYDSTGTYIYSSPNNTIINLESCFNQASGVQFTSSDNSVIRDSNVSYMGTSNNRFGVSIASSSNITVSNVTTEGNFYGVGIQSNSANNTIANVMARYNGGGGGGAGLYTASSSWYNTFENCTVIGSSGYANALFQSGNNTLLNSTLLNSVSNGVEIWSADNNTIKNSIIANTSGYGIYLNSANNNSIYNNLINNTKNFYNQSAGLVNYFNTTLQIGTNIIGGSWIGGNYWDNYSAPGTGFSATCTDSARNGICDSSFSPDGTNYDYLPLSDQFPKNYTCDSVSSCNSAIQSAGIGDTIFMNQSITYSSNGTAIDFQGVDGITFDCNVYSLTGPGITNTANIGIYFSSGSNNDITKNCNVSNFYVNVGTSSGINDTVLNTTSTGGNRGISLTSANNFTLRDNNFSGNVYNLRFAGSTATNIQDWDSSNTLDYNKRVYFNYSASNYVFNSTTAPNASMIICSYCNNVTYRDLSLGSSNLYGLYFYFTGNSSVDNVTSEGNDYGIYAAYGSNNTFINNNANSNRVVGFYLNSETKDILSGNSMNNNSQYNLYFLASGTSGFDNTIDPSNTVDYGYRIYYNYSISNYEFNSTTAPNAGVIYCVSCNNVTYKDLNLSHHNYYGLYFYNTTNSLVQNVSANNNYYGINLYTSSGNNTLTGITSNYNGAWGINVQASNNVVNDSYFSYNGIGGAMSNGVNCTFVNVTSFNNTQYGFEFNGGSFILANSTSSLNNASGLYFGGSAINGSHVYNNLFNNTVNYGEITPGSNTSFNRSLSLGTNIVGGPNLGGNYWSYPNGTGFSDTCADLDRNGICDSPYSPDGTNYDYLALDYKYLPGTLECGSVSYCNSVINSSIPGDVIELNTSLSGISTTAINLTNIQNITFDCLGHYINGTGVASTYGIYLSGTNYTTIENCNVSNFNSGIGIISSFNNTLPNNTANSNSYRGIFLSASSNNTISNNTVNSNSDGIAIYSGLYNVLTNNTANSNTNGIYLSSSLNNSLKSNTANQNSNYGIYLTSSSNNTFLNNTANLNNYGIEVYSLSYSNLFESSIVTSNTYGITLISSYNNTINDSVVSNSSLYGLQMGTSNNNTFYNNIFNNTVNYYNSSVILLNYFNTTLTSGTNIVGGTYLGGNAWDNYSAPGTLSFGVCTDSNSNGICDSNYTLSDNVSIDYLPLTSYTAPVTVTPTTSGGGTTVTSTSSGGGVTTTTTTQANVTTSVSKLVNFTQGISQNVVLGSDQLGLTSMTVNSKINASNVNITVTKAPSVSSADLQIASSGATYETYDIALSGINDSNLNNVSMNFKVNKSWFTDNGLNLSSLLIYRNPGTGWTPLVTSLLTSDQQYYYFAAISPGFSTYTVFAAYNVKSSESSSSSILNRLKNFFSGFTPEFFRQTSWGYVFYYLIVVLILGGIVLVSVRIYKTAKTRPPKIWSKAHGIKR